MPIGSTRHPSTAGDSKRKGYREALTTEAKEVLGVDVEGQSTHDYRWTPRIEEKGKKVTLGTRMFNNNHARGPLRPEKVGQQSTKCLFYCPKGDGTREIHRKVIIRT